MVFFVPDPQSSGPPGEPGPVGTGDIVSAHQPVLGANNQAFAGGLPFVKLTGWLTVDGQAVGGTPDQANDRLIVTNGGVWRVHYVLSIRAAVGFSPLSTHLRINGVEAPEVQGQAAIITNIPLVIAARGTVTLAPGDVLEVYGACVSPATANWLSGTFSAMRVA